MNKTNSFDRDIRKDGQYKYTNFNKYSAYIATKKQSDEITKLLKKHAGKNIKILDVGCGDGTFTLEVFRKINPKQIVGFDSTERAVRVASKAIEKKDQNSIKFLHCDIYDAYRKFKKGYFDLIIVRGVLHHLNRPKLAVKSLSRLSERIIVLEPNGYNPILKIIERLSPYHRQHGEKSYWPPTLNKWFIDNGLEVRTQVFFSIVPYFCPKNIAKLLKFFEPFMEKIPFVKKIYCGTNLIYYEKK